MHESGFRERRLRGAGNDASALKDNNSKEGNTREEVGGGRRRLWQCAVGVHMSEMVEVIRHEQTYIMNG